MCLCHVLKACSVKISAVTEYVWFYNARQRNRRSLVTRVIRESGVCILKLSVPAIDNLNCAHYKPHKKMPFIKYAAPTKKQGNLCDKCVYPSLQKKALHTQRNFVCIPQVGEDTVIYGLHGYVPL